MLEYTKRCREAAEDYLEALQALKRYHGYDTRSPISTMDLDISDKYELRVAAAERHNVDTMDMLIQVKHIMQDRMRCFPKAKRKARSGIIKKSAPEKLKGRELVEEILRKRKK